MLEIIAAIGIIGFVIFQQLAGQALRGKKVVLLPTVLTAIGFTELGGGKHLQPVDIACLAAGCVLSIAIGLTFGAIMHLESRDGVLWAKMPVKGLWLWLALVASRGLMYVVAAGLHAHVAESGAPILLTLGLNRLAQAAVVVPRALSAGVPFAPEKDGKTFMSGVLGQAQTASRPGFTTTPPRYDTYTTDTYNSASNAWYTDDLRTGPIDLGTYRPQRQSTQDNHSLAPTDWRHLTSTATEHLAGNNR
jgi:hypothetical protein